MVARLLVLGLSTFWACASALPITGWNGTPVEVPGSRLVNGRAYLPCAWLNAHRPDLTCQDSGRGTAFLWAAPLNPSTPGWSISRLGWAFPTSGQQLAPRQVPPPVVVEGQTLIAASALRTLSRVDVTWQGSTLTVSLLPRLRAALRVIGHGELREARVLAGQLRERTGLPEDYNRGDAGAGPVVILYPEGEVRRFFVWQARTLSAYEVREGWRVQVWQAAVGLPPASLWGEGPGKRAGQGDTLERLAGPFARTQGRRSAVTGRYRTLRVSPAHPAGQDDLRVGWVELDGTAKPVAAGNGLPDGVQLPGEVRRD
ncbi:hypothetical protein Dcar01_00824 [Deinococcus carri]|uniref:Uncharacterized protein n=1 Tax=Deinococcus carri TaxID=1211323 RepID=A0ABP9W5M7_9DEIO